MLLLLLLLWFFVANNDIFREHQGPPFKAAKMVAGDKKGFHSNKPHFLHKTGMLIPHDGNIFIQATTDHTAQTSTPFYFQDQHSC